MAEKQTHYHELGLFNGFRGFLGRCIGFHIDWDIKRSEGAVRGAEAMLDAALDEIDLRPIPEDTQLMLDYYTLEQ